MIIKDLNKGFFIFVLAITTLGFLHILEPYFSAILWATILAMIFHPLKIKIRKYLGNRNGLSALILTLIICLIVFVPLSIVASSLAIECNALYNRIHNNQTQLTSVTAEVISYFPSWLKHFLIENKINDVNAIQEKLSSMAMKGGQFFAGGIMIIGKSTFSFTVGFSIMLYLLFFLLKDGAYIVSLALDAIPLSQHFKQHLFVKFAAVARATVKSTIVIAIVQGAIGGLAFWSAGIEDSILWGSLMAFLSIIPAIGTAIIWLPVGLYYSFSGEVFKGIILIFFFVVIIGLIDNILRPLLVGKNTKMPDYLILITTLGGMNIYGINGFVIGPLIAALFISCWNLLSGRDHIGNTEEIDPNFMQEVIDYLEKNK